MLRPEFSGQFKRDYKLALKRGCDPKKLEEVISILCREEPLPPSYRDHALVNSRDYKGKARKIIEGIAKDIEVGDVYLGKVVRIMNFGAFIELTPGKDRCV